MGLVINMKNKFAALALIVSFLTTSFVYSSVLPNSTDDYVRFLKEKLNFSLDKEKSTNDVVVYKKYSYGYDLNG